MGNVYSQIPGYRDAVARETVGRDAAYLQLPRLVAGVVLRPLTLRDYLRLSAESSPFIAGGRPGKDDCAFLLWHQRLELGETLDPPEFARRLDAMEISFLVASCDEYISPFLMDAPGGGGSGKGGYYGLGAMLVNAFRAEYSSATRDEVLDTPLDILFQEWRAIASKRPGMVLFNRSDRIKGAYLASLGQPTQATKRTPTRRVKSGRSGRRG